MRALLAAKGIHGRDFAVRPLVKRGYSDDGVAIGEDNTVPELTVTADGWHWHPAGADLETSPDFLIGTPDVPMREAKRRSVELFLGLRQSDGSLPWSTTARCSPVPTDLGSAAGPAQRW